ncbi:hypothetical protein ACS0TY_031034 [Phlomoides rotata]
MGKRFLLIFFTLYAFFVVLHARPHNSSNLRHRSLLQSPDLKNSIADPPSGKEDDHKREVAAEAPTEWESRKIGKHRSSDKSMAAGGVILGGLLTATFAAVYCYIRVTRKRHTQNSEMSFS